MCDHYLEVAVHNLDKANQERDAARARVEQLEQAYDEARHQLELVTHHLGHLRPSVTMKAAGYALIAEHELTQRSKRVAQLERLLRAALDENPSWYSEATKEAEELLEDAP